ncbi:hypothetical protein C0Q70_12166 [Pomacea canaliculata]|uniref:Uncharacterized protein n=1 Tax=Pomacea canaliculata TaxID=400727 RepID=A0A2T7P0U0_POMCA|nr:hypothetical protein C0Q70_12166 [Pomacea canaliculata]
MNTADSSEASGAEVDTSKSEDEMLAVPIATSDVGSSDAARGSIRDVQMADAFDGHDTLDVATQEQEPDQPRRRPLPRPRTGGRSRTAPAWQRSGDYVYILVKANNGLLTYTIMEDKGRCQSSSARQRRAESQN